MNRLDKNRRSKKLSINRQPFHRMRPNYFFISLVLTKPSERDVKLYSTKMYQTPIYY